VVLFFASPAKSNTTTMKTLSVLFVFSLALISPVLSQYPAATVLTNGVTVTNTTNNDGSPTYYVLNTANGTAAVLFNITVGANPLFFIQSYDGSGVQEPANSNPWWWSCPDPNAAATAVYAGVNAVTSGVSQSYTITGTQLTPQQVALPTTPITVSTNLQGNIPLTFLVRATQGVPFTVQANSPFLTSNYSCPANEDYTHTVSVGPSGIATLTDVVNSQTGAYWVSVVQTTPPGLATIGVCYTAGCTVSGITPAPQTTGTTGKTSDASTIAPAVIAMAAMTFAVAAL